MGVEGEMKQVLRGMKWVLRRMKWDLRRVVSGC